MITNMTTQIFGTYDSAVEAMRTIKASNPGEIYKVRCIQGHTQGGTQMVVVRYIASTYSWVRV